MSAQPATVQKMTKAEAQRYIEQRKELQELQSELGALNGPLNAKEALAAIDLAIERNSLRLTKTFVGVMRGQESVNPHAEWTGAQSAEAGASLLKTLFTELGSDDVIAALLMPLLKKQLHDALAKVRYDGHDSPAMDSRRKRAAELKDAIQKLKVRIVPPQTPEDQQLCESLTGRSFRW